MSSKEQLLNIRESFQTKLRLIRYDSYILLFLLLLSLLGIGLTDAFGKWSRWYWLAMIPIFYGCDLFLEWQTAKDKGIRFISLLTQQVQYWIGLFGAVYLTFFLEQLGSFNNETTGMILMLVLALSIFQTGVTRGWLFQLLGVFLGLCLMVVAYVENYIWAILALSIIVMVAYIYLQAKIGKSKS